MASCLSYKAAEECLSLRDAKSLGDLLIIRYISNNLLPQKRGFNEECGSGKNLIFTSEFGVFFQVDNG
jgi:hypothetical protein